MIYIQRALALVCLFLGVIVVSHAAPIKSKLMVVSTPVSCLAVNIYHEARGEAVAGQYAVAMVTLNRAERQPRNICKVVFKSKQFSWTNKLVQKVSKGWKLHPQLQPGDSKAWALAYKIAVKTLSGNVKDTTKGSKFYHTKDVHPKWANKMQLTKVIGRHEFFVQVASN